MKPKTILIYFSIFSDYDGRTALHLAAAEGHLDCVIFLLSCGVPHDPKDRWGNLPFDEAETFGHEKVADYLRQWNEKLENVVNKNESKLDVAAFELQQLELSKEVRGLGSKLKKFFT